MAVTTLWVLVGIFLFASINHLILSLGKPRNQNRLLFSAMCALAAVFAGLDIGLYQSESITEYLLVHRLITATGLMFFCVLPWFVSIYLKSSNLKITLGFNFVFGCLLLINLFRDNALYFDKIHTLETRILPWGEQIAYVNADYTPFAALCWTIIFFLFLFIIFVCIRDKGKNDKSNRLNKKKYLASSLIIFFAFSIVDPLVDYGFIDFMYTGVYGFLAMVLMMSFVISNEANKNAQSLIDKQTHLRLALNAANIGTWEWNMRTEEVDCSDGLHYLFGLRKEKFKPSYSGYLSLLDSRYVKIIEEKLHDSLKNNVPYYVEHPLTWPDGSIHWLANRGEIERDSKGEPVLMRGSVIDITGHKSTENRLFRTQKKLRMHIEQTPLGVIEWDVRFHVSDWNEAAEKIFGYTKIEALGKHANQIIVPDEIKTQVNEVWAALLSSKGGRRSTNENITKDGRTIICQWYNTPLVKDDGQVIGVASMVSDITDSVNTQTELTEHRNSLEEKVSQRTAELKFTVKELESFSYSVSHDLRAPLRSINGFSTALLEDYYDLLDDTGKEYLSRVINSSDRMANLIDDLLELSRLSRSEMKREFVDLSEHAKYAFEKLQELEIDRKVIMKVDETLEVVGDKRLLGLVMDNLIGNAWKYSSKNKKAEIEFGSFQENNNTVYFVKDNGAGFNMRYSNKMFTAFQRLHGTDEFEGTGIGLATVWRLIQRHGGRVWSEGEVGKGATFYFTINERVQG